MKFNWKKLAALLLAAILMLSMTGLSEDEIAIEDGASIADVDAADDGIIIDEAAPDDIPAVEDGELDLLLEDLELSIPDVDSAAPAAEAVVAPAKDGDDEEITSNGLVTKVKIGVKEKYTINTSSLKGKLTFASSNKKVATVSKKGVVKGKKAGTARITITTAKKKQYKVTVTVAKAPKKVTLNKKTATLEIGDTLKLKAKLPNKTASNKMTWTSSDKSVATVSKKGKVTAKGEGTATITVKTFNGKKATCEVTVEAPEPEPEPGYSGDIWYAIGMDFDVFNDTIDDSLTLYSYDDDYIVYINNYMMVTVSYNDNSILTIMLTSGDNNRKYTIDGICPGYNLVTCRMMAEAADWTYWKTEGYLYFYRATYHGETIYLVLSASGNQGSSNVEYVAIMRTE